MTHWLAFLPRHSHLLWHCKGCHREGEGKTLARRRFSEAIVLRRFQVTPTGRRTVGLTASGLPRDRATSGASLG